jgi:hypothetical protein
MTIRERLQALEKRREALSQMIAKFEAERDEALASLPSRFGYQSLEGFLAALIEAQPRGTKKRRRRGHVAKASGKGDASTVVAASNPKLEAPEETRGAPAVAHGSDLGDPRNFCLLPDISLLDPPSFPDSGYYDRLSQTLAYARRVLGTSGVPAAVWREWRAYEQKVGEVLRNRHGHSTPDA